MQKINFSGGEPFIHQKGKYLGDLVKYCKVDLGLRSVTIVSNGSLITEEWFQEYGKIQVVIELLIPILYGVFNISMVYTIYIYICRVQLSQ